MDKTRLMNIKPGFKTAVVSALAFALALLAAPLHAQADFTRVKDLGKVQGWRDNALVGYGIVTGLAGTGDSPGNRVTRQALANVYAQFNLTIPSEQVQSRNVAIVMVSASMSPFARSGDTLDVTVTSAGDARSLLGGSLLLTPLKGADGEVHALAQGALTVGGYRYDANGNVVQKNHPNLGAIPGGATVELGVESKVMRQNGSVTFVLAEPDYTTASRVARAINSQFRADLARPRDASGIDIDVPAADRARLVDFLAKVENVAVEPDRRAKVVINERTGTLVSGGDVRISSVSISHGDLKLSIASQTSVSQPLVIGRPGDGVQTALVTNTQIDVDEPRGAGYVKAQTTVADLVQSLSRMKIGTRDMISILRAVKAAGALHGELVVQ
jgi:flagellar P-ring protein precursor FlgI